MNQGDIFWVDLGDTPRTETGYRCLSVVIQNNVFNRSQINTVLVCALTSNLKRAAAPGNLLLKSEETGLPESVVVSVCQVFTVHKSQFKEKVGHISADRVRQILDGVRLLTEPREVE